MTKFSLTHCQSSVLNTLLNNIKFMPGNQILCILECLMNDSLVYYEAFHFFIAHRNDPDKD